MLVRFHKQFEKQYRKCTPKLQNKILEAVEDFKQNPYELRLRNHPLHGGMQGQRSFSVTGDIRIIFHQENNYQRVTMLDVGTHNQVYK